MRLILLLVMISPVFAGAQINRSAKEFAMDRVQEYMATKMFKNRSYTPVSYGQLKPAGQTGSKISWLIEHSFEVELTKEVDGEKIIARKPGKLWFYMDNKMKIIRADSYELY